jgi:outer membrane protein OmpU
MNKLTKIGVSALCGSLAAISAANAGSMSVAGGATATYSKLGYGETGNPFGMATGLTFTGSGELDNGNAVTLNITHDDQNAFSAADISVDVAGLGKFSFDQGGGTGIDRFDDKMPTAWEETTGTAVGTGLQTVAGVGGQTDIEWAISSDMLPDGVSAYISWSPKADGGKSNDKATTGATGAPNDGMGYDIALSHTGLADGLEVFGGYSSISQGVVDDRTAYVVGAVYAVGSVTIGYQYSRDGVDSGGTDYYENHAVGVAFSVNDDLSISYGRHESERGDTGLTGTTVEADSLQMAYSMGGASLKIAETSVDNQSYVSGTAADRDGTTIALTLAF